MTFHLPSHRVSNTDLYVLHKEAETKSVEGADLALAGQVKEVETWCQSVRQEVVGVAISRIAKRLGEYDFFKRPIQETPQTPAIRQALKVMQEHHAQKALTQALVRPNLSVLKRALEQGLHPQDVDMLVIKALKSNHLPAAEFLAPHLSGAEPEVMVQSAIDGLVATSICMDLFHELTPQEQAQHWSAMLLYPATSRNRKDLLETLCADPCMPSDRESGLERALATAQGNNNTDLMQWFIQSQGVDPRPLMKKLMKNPLALESAECLASLSPTKYHRAWGKRWPVLVARERAERAGDPADLPKSRSRARP